MRSIPSSTAILILSAALTACGGSSSSSDDPAPVDPTDPTPPTDPTDPTDPPASTGGRIGSINYDLDNNGTVDATATILYEDNGFPSDFNYTYIGDGTPDTSDGITGLRGAEEVSLTFSIFDDRFLARTIQENKEVGSGITTGRFEIGVQWNTNGLATESRTESYNSSGGQTNRNITTVSYNGTLVSGWNEVQESFLPASTVNAIASVTYDGDNQPTDVNYTVGGVVNIDKALTWNQGRTTTSATTTNSGTDTITYGYTADGLRLETRTIDDGTTTQVHTFVYDANSRLSEIRYDRDNDGVIDAVETPVWEDSACETAISWNGFSGEEPLLSTTSSPYLNGTGYGLINFCDDTGHAR